MNDPLNALKVSRACYDELVRAIRDLPETERGNMVLPDGTIVLRSTWIEKPADDILAIGRIAINRKLHKVFISGDDVSFSRKEYDLLEFFMSRPSETLSYREILGAVWGRAHVENVQYLRVYTGHVRDKIAGYAEIINQSGRGYRLEVTQ